MPPGLTEAPGFPSGWQRLAEALAPLLPAAELDGIWTFAPVRRDRRELGTAILSRVDGERRRLYTARYALTIRGPERGRFRHELEEVGSGPLDARDRLLDDVRRRLDDEEPPEPQPLDRWFPGSPDAAPRP